MTIRQKIAARSWSDEPCRACAQSGRVRVFGIRLMCFDCDGLGRILRATQ